MTDISQYIDYGKQILSFDDGTWVKVLIPEDHSIDFKNVKFDKVYKHKHTNKFFKTIGYLHSMDGTPAVYYPDGDFEWYIYGRNITPQVLDWFVINNKNIELTKENLKELRRYVQEIINGGSCLV